VRCDRGESVRKREVKLLTRWNVRESLLCLGRRCLIKAMVRAVRYLSTADRSDSYSTCFGKGNPTDIRAVFSSWRRWERTDNGYNLPNDFGVDAVSKAFGPNEALRIGMYDDRTVLQATTRQRVRSISPHQKV
jgi:hypothetical protein